MINIPLDKRETKEKDVDIVSTILKNSLDNTINFELNQDKDLRRLINKADKFLEPEDLVCLIKKVSKYDSTASVHKSLPGQYAQGRLLKKIPSYDLRKTLKQLPKFIELSDDNQLSYKQSIALLFKVIDSRKNPELTFAFEVVSRLNDLLETCKEHKMPFLDSLEEFNSSLNIYEVQREISYLISITRLGVNAGMSLKQAIDFVSHLCKESTLPEYTLMSLYDELNGLRTACLSGESLFKVLKGLSGEDPYYNIGYYSLFTDYLYKKFAYSKFSSQEIVDNFNLRLNNRDGFIEGEHSKNETIDIIKTKEQYFPLLNEERLVHGFLPYYIKKDFASGLTDLYNLMLKDFKEGAWIFDPNEEKWFSFGGRTEIGLRKIRHEFIPYNISLLSKNPNFVHIHSEKVEIILAPYADSLDYPAFQKKLTKLFSCLPSKRDINTIKVLIKDAPSNSPLTSLIVTSLGITEIITPNNYNAINNLSKNYDAITTTAFKSFDLDTYYQIYDIKESDITFVKRIFELINKRLPKGFSINLYNIKEYIRNSKR